MKIVKRIALFIMAVVFSLGIFGVFSEYVPVDDNPSQVEAEGAAYLTPAWDGNWYLIVDGQIAWWYNGLFYDQNVGWWLVQNGRIAFEYNDLYCDPNLGWWLVTGGTVNFGYNGLFGSPTCGWWYVSGGAVAFNYTGLAYYNDVFWCVRNGMLDFGYTGMVYYENFWWYVSNGVLDLNYTGLACNEYGWFYYYNGGINWYYTGFADNQYGSWYIQNGQLNFGYTGMVLDGGKWHYVQGGQRIPNYTGMACYPGDGTWWYFKNGIKQERYTGMACNDAGWWYYTGGQIDWTYTGMAQNEYGWWYYKNGNLDFGYKGIARNQYGTWYMTNGTINTKYNGQYRDGVVTYQVKNGKATAVSATQLQLAVFFNSREDVTDSLYMSFDGYDFNYLGNAFTDTTPNDESKFVDVNSPSLNAEDPDTTEFTTLHDPGLMYKDGYFWLVGAGRVGEKFFPFLSHSKDLVNWSKPSSGDGWTGLTPTVWPYAADKTRTNHEYMAAGADLLADDDGTAWVVVSMGNYEDNNDRDVMSAYLVHITSMTVNCDNPTTWQDRNIEPTITYDRLIPIELPQKSTNWIDQSLYKENGKYYLVIKKDGVQIQIYSINNLNNASNPKAWTLVNNDAVSGYEGPTITKFNGDYIMYTDRLIGYPHFDTYTDSKPGIFAISTSNMSGAWGDNVKVNLHDAQGHIKEGRHGAVITITDQSAINRILARYNALGY